MLKIEEGSEEFEITRYVPTPSIKWGWRKLKIGLEDILNTFHEIKLEETKKR